MSTFPSEQQRKIFVGGLNLETTDESLKNYFSRWGDCLDVVVMRHSDTGKPRGFGFVTYENVESVDAVLNVESHTLDGKKIDPKRAVAREETSQSHSIKQEEGKSRENCRVFVGGLASATTEEDVRRCFTQFCKRTGYGTVENVEIMRNREDGKCRGFGFVTFGNHTDIVEKVCAEQYFEIINKTTEVRRAESRLAMMERKDRARDFDGRKTGDRRRGTKYGYKGSQSMGSSHSGSAMQRSMPGEYNGSGAGRGFDGFNMNPMAFAGMMNMFASYMGMNMGNMGGAMGNMGMNQMGNMDGAMGNMNRNQMSGQNYGGGGCLSSNSNGAQGSKNYSGLNVNTSSQVANTSMGNTLGYADNIGTMYGLDPANFQAALCNAYSAGNNQFGVYNNQSSSSYGPVKNTSTGAIGSNQGYKPY